MRKRIGPIFIAALLTLAALIAVMYTSCKKDTCSGVICLNGGTCSGGRCKCPAGYTSKNCETIATTYITYKNNTFTPVTIVINGKASVIAASHSITYSGQYTTYLFGSASTSGSTDSGEVVGDLITWNIANPFPISDTAAIGLDVSPTYFYLKIKNNNPHYSIAGFYYGDSISGGYFFVSINIPGDGVMYDLGYYNAYDNNNGITFVSSSGANLFVNFTLPFVNNQYYIAIFP
ncbi:MAG: calcium-binding EGF-like domain-containing protein [Chitinophagales bacterium]